MKAISDTNAIIKISNRTQYLSNISKLIYNLHCYAILPWSWLYSSGLKFRRIRNTIWNFSSRTYGMLCSVLRCIAMQENIWTECLCHWTTFHAGRSSFYNLNLQIVSLLHIIKLQIWNLVKKQCCLQYWTQPQQEWNV